MKTLLRLTKLSWLHNLIARRRVPTLENPVSQACTEAQMREPIYSYWCDQIGETPNFHRKQWEFCYILQVLAKADMLVPGKCGLGFGVGSEPLAASFASRGVSVLGTDLEPESAYARGWVETEQHAESKRPLNQRGLCKAEAFDKLVEFRFMDMNEIDPDLNGQFDFCWSACAFEHLGSIANGLEFVVRSINCLKPGGVAVHTTEFNCSSNDVTLDNSPTVLFRKRDITDLARRLRAQGHLMSLNFNLGDNPLDEHVDVPPYSNHKHLKLLIEKFVSTSYGIVVKKREEA